MKVNKRNKNSIGRRWHVRIIKAGLTQIEVAEQAGCTYNTLNDIVRGKHKNPLPETRQKIEAALTALGA